MALNCVLLILGLMICFGAFAFRNVSTVVIGFFWGSVTTLVISAVLWFDGRGLYHVDAMLKSGWTIALILIAGVAVAALSVLFDRFFAAGNAFFLSFLFLFLMGLGLSEGPEDLVTVSVISVILALIAGIVSWVYHRNAALIVTVLTGAAMAVFAGFAVFHGESLA